MTELKVKTDFGHQALDHNQLVDWLRGNTVVEGLEPTVGTDDFEVDVTEGEAVVNGTVHTVSAGSVTLSAPDSDPRKDLVVVDTDGNLAVEEGTPEAEQPDGAERFFTDTPTPEDLDIQDYAVIAEVWVAEDATELVTDDIRDRRLVPNLFLNDVTALTDVDLNQNVIEGLAKPTEDDHATNKAYVDTETGEVQTNLEQHDHTEAEFQQVPNNGLVNDSVTVTAGNALENGGTVALGGTITVDVETDGIATDELDLSITPTWTGNHAFQAGLDVDADITDGETVIWDNTSQHLPQGRLENDTLTVAGNTVSLGGSTDVNYTDLLNRSHGNEDHTETFTTTDEDVSNFDGSAGTQGQFLQTDGTNLDFADVSTKAFEEVEDFDSIPADPETGKGFTTTDKGELFVEVNN